MAQVVVVSRAGYLMPDCSPPPPRPMWNRHARRTVFSPRGLRHDARLVLATLAQAAPARNSLSARVAGTARGLPALVSADERGGTATPARAHAAVPRPQAVPSLRRHGTG